MPVALYHRTAACVPRCSPATLRTAAGVPTFVRFFTSTRIAAAAAEKEPLSTEPMEEKPAGDAKAAEPGSAAGAGAAGAGDAHADAVKALEAEVAKLKSQLTESNTARLRLLAEMENVRVIARRDVDIAKTYSIQSFAKRLVDAVDNLHAAVTSVPEELRSKDGAGAAAARAADTLALLYDGVAATERSLLKTLAEFGITKFGAAGDKFDPNRYEAMLQTPASDATPEGTVSQVLKTGYAFKERTLRPAQVAVAAKLS